MATTIEQLLVERYGHKTVLNLNDYAEIMGIGRKGASEHLKASGIPYYQVRQKMTLLLTDIITYFNSSENKKINGESIQASKEAAQPKRFYVPKRGA